MFTVRRSIEIDAGHRVPFHDSKCKYLHGHRWKIVACVSAPSLVPDKEQVSDSGMVLDFGVIKNILMEEIHDRFDHRMILWEKDPLFYPKAVVGSPAEFPAWQQEVLKKMRTVLGDNWLQQVPCIPTSEGLAEYWGALVSNRLEATFAKDSFRKGETFHLSALEVWETPNGVATWTAPKIVKLELDLS